MVSITEDLIRKRAEHNECIISTLEEISLHQQDIERIEYLDKWCKDLKILYLQSNLIPRIENVGRLKKLEYLNLALNNIELIENLEGCESLKKLDLTVNFVGHLTSVESLKANVHLRELYLTGNPCTDYVDYRNYVIATLPQLQSLDGIEIERSERIKACQILHESRPGIIQQQNIHKKKREKQKAQAALETNGVPPASKSGTDWYNDTQSTSKAEMQAKDTPEELEKTEDQRNKEFWDEKVPFTPESRLAVHEHMKDQRQRENKKEEKPVKLRSLQTPDGRVLNCNEAKVDFSLQDDEEQQAVVLDVAVFRHMDTSLCDVDVQPTYVKVTLKGKVLQLVLPVEVNADASTAKRSQVTGHLLITMPKAKSIVTGKLKKSPVQQNEKPHHGKGDAGYPDRPVLLEVDPSVARTVDIANIMNSKPSKTPLSAQMQPRAQERANSTDFVDDPDVPPLE